MQAVRQEIESHTKKELLATAPTISAADELEQRGFENAQTVQRLLTNQGKHKELKPSGVSPSSMSLAVAVKAH